MALAGHPNPRTRVDIVSAIMITEVLFHEPHVVVTGSKSPLLRRRNLRLKDLIHER